ncbi:MAG: tetratricopeptide repeat protein [Chitinophagaceae bacterium]
MLYNGMDRIKTLQTLLEKEPNDSFLLHCIALEYIKIEQYDNAQPLFEKIITTNPSYVGTYYHLAQLYERIKDLDKAKECYEQGMKVAQLQKNQHAYNELQMAYEDLTI